MWQTRFFVEEESAAWYLVVEGNSAHRHTSVFIYHAGYRRVDRMEHHVIFDAVAEEFQFFGKQFRIVARGKDMQRGRASQHAERRDHTEQPEAMVAMEMGYEHMSQLGESYPRASQLQLCSFATVDHKLLSTQFDDL